MALTSAAFRAPCIRRIRGSDKNKILKINWSHTQLIEEWAKGRSEKSRI